MKLVAALIVVVVGAASIACGTTTVVKKKSANADCQKDPTKCPDDPSPNGEGDTTDTEEDPIQAVPDPGSVTTAADAGSPDAQKDTQKKDAAPPPGSECTQLDACCTQLGDAGYDTTTCKGYVASHDETTCKTQHASYKSFGDCT